MRAGKRASSARNGKFKLKDNIQLAFYLAIKARREYFPVAWVSATQAGMTIFEKRDNVI
jgi:hypothetical protein